MKMRPGTVISIRVPTEDIMSCIDLVEQAQCSYYGMSLARVVRLALSGLLDAARKQGTVPTRDGFEYDALVQKYTNVKHGQKVKLSNAAAAVDAGRAAMDMEPVRPHIPSGSVQLSDAEVVATRQRARIMMKIAELKFREENNPENWTMEDAAALRTMQEEFDALAGSITDV